MIQIDGCRWRWIFLSVTGLFLALVLFGCGRAPQQAPVSDVVAEKALAIALTKLDAPYALGGRGPDAFDCSGLITWAYKQALGKDGVFRVGRRVTTDANMLDIYRDNVQMIPFESASPGDIVFITDQPETVTHGGLFIGWKDANTLEFINASSYEPYRKVVVDTWPVQGSKRGQRLVGIGRLLCVL